MKKIFAPGCALTIYKPYLADRLHTLLCENIENMDRLDICCRNKPLLEDNTEVINVCPGCDRRFRENYTNSTTIHFGRFLRSDFSRFLIIKEWKCLFMMLVQHALRQEFIKLSELFCIR